MRLAPGPLLFATDSAYLDLYSFEGAFFIWLASPSSSIMWSQIACGDRGGHSTYPLRQRIMHADLRVLETSRVGKFNQHFIIADFYQMTDQKIERRV